MAKGILGRKIGMTQIFDENGMLVPVTVVDVRDNVVLQQKTEEIDGYVATQLGFETKREKLSNKSEKGHAAKANTEPKRFVREIRFPNFENELTKLSVGDVVEPSIFEAGDYVDVIGTSKGKGFQGVIKRHNQRTGPQTHGSRFHRRPGSMGSVKGNIKGKKLPGQMGNVKTTIQNLRIVAVDTENQVLLISGNIPGPKKGLVVIQSAVKKAV